MNLIVDAGSTKAEWILIDGRNLVQRIVTKGFNPNYSEKQCLEDMVSSVETCHGASLHGEIQSIHYYGTGCGNERNSLLIKEVLQQHFPDAEIHVTHDLMAVCHALLGHEEGMACILGTGSNSCVYDGEKIVESAVSLGYLVGDEGSGMHIGKEVVRSYFYGFMPKDLRNKFNATYGLTREELLENLYHKPQPSRYLASFAQFAGDNQAHPYIHELVKGCFKAFIEAFVLRYDNCKLLKISFVGSIAFHFREILQETLADEGLTLGAIMQTPTEGLVKYYQR